MPSPFPGMDPYLEHPSFWLDFHSRFINIWCEAIAEKLPGDYEASIGERVYLVEEDPDSRKLIFPDVAVSLDEGGRFPSNGSEGPRETFIEILHHPERSLVAVLELLSPTNKNPPGRAEYMMKRGAILLQSVHLVELDLLRGGQRPPIRKPWPMGDFYYLVSRYEDRPDGQVYSWSLRQPLPTLPVPLRAPDADLQIDLAAVFGTAYDRGRFARRLPYRGACPIPLSTADDRWTREIVQTKLGG